jgi:hypothetical protein
MIFQFRIGADSTLEHILFVQVICKMLTRLFSGIGMNSAECIHKTVVLQQLGARPWNDATIVCISDHFLIILFFRGFLM